MSNQVRKIILKHLANAPAIAAREALREFSTDEDRNEARRIFAAVGITPHEPTKAAHRVTLYNNDGDAVSVNHFTTRQAAQSFAKANAHGGELSAVID